jgi:hypothetical protein
MLARARTNWRTAGYSTNAARLVARRACAAVEGIIEPCKWRSSSGPRAPALPVASCDAAGSGCRHVHTGPSTSPGGNGPVAWKTMRRQPPLGFLGAPLPDGLAVSLRERACEKGLSRGPVTTL